MRLASLSILLTAIGSVVSAQSLHQGPSLSQPGPLERQARRATPLDILYPKHTPAPQAPNLDAATGAEYRFVVVYVVDKQGKVVESRVDYFEASTPAGGTARSDVVTALSAAIIRAVNQWTFDPPLEGPVKHLVGFRVTPDGRFARWEIPGELRVRVGPAETR